MRQAMSRGGFRIGVDARIALASGTGVTTYARTLMRSLVDLGQDVVALTDHAAENGAYGKVRRTVASLSPGAARARESRRIEVAGAILPSLSGRDLFRRAQQHFNVYGRVLRVNCPHPPAVMHWSYPLPLSLNGAKNVYTIHDTIPLDSPGLTSIDQGRHRRLLHAIEAQADGLVTVSEAAASALAAQLEIDPKRIANFGQAVDVDLCQPSALPRELVAKDYFIFCGSIEPRKNLVALIKAHRLSGAKRRLVIVGPDGWRSEESLAAIADNPGALRLPWLSRDQLISVMAQARGMLFCSLDEGFGLPVAEALTLGVPVIASDLPATREVGSGAAQFVDPNDVAAIAAAIGALDRDDGLYARMAAASTSVSGRFARAPYAARLLSYYREIMTFPAAA